MNKYYVWFQWGTEEEGMEKVGYFEAQNEIEAIEKGIKEYRIKNSDISVKLLKTCLHAKKIENTMKEIEKIEILNPLEFKKVYLANKLNETKEKAKYEYGCIMAKIGQSLFDESEYNHDNLYKPEDERYGIEQENHCTLLYGIHSFVKEEDVVNFLKCLKTPKLSLTGIGIFSNPEFDVVKYNIESNDLSLMNELTKKLFEFTSTFPNYIPHITISYMLPGTGSGYVKDFDPIECSVSSWIYSQADGRKIEIDLEGNITVLREANE